MIYLIIINAAALLFYGLDKLFAVRDMWRIPERTLLFLAAAGGSPGALAGMLVFRHKIRKPVFYITVPVCLALQSVLLFLLKSGIF